MGSQVQLTRTAELAPRPGSAPGTAPRQLNLVLDDVRLQGMTTVQRQAALKPLAQLLLEASGAVTEEYSDDDA
jgi:hypothetical protein